MATRGWTVPVGVVAVGAPLLGSLLAGCAGEPRASSAAPGDPTGTVAIGVTMPSEPLQDLDDADSTDPDPDLVAACQQWVKFQAYVGDPEGVQLWDTAGNTEQGLALTCTDLVKFDPGRAAVMRDQMTQLAADQAEAATATTLAPGCHPSYGDCLPIVTDIDCQGDGDGPIHLAISVLVLGNDVYELDRDQDGLACEPGDR